MKKNGFWFRFLGLHLLDGFGSLAKVLLAAMGIIAMMIVLRVLFHFVTGAF